MKKLNYILASGAKYHHFSVARALYKRNQLSKIISGYPWFKLKNEKLPRSKVGAYGIYQILRYPFIRNKLLLHFETIPRILDVSNRKYIDKKICEFIENDLDADVLIALCPTGLEAGKKMLSKKKIYICERSSAHILYQEKLLAEEYKEFMNKKFRINPYFVETELKMYDDSDIIMVPSHFVKNSFKGELSKKVYVNEFGTDTKNFFPDKNIKKSDKYFDIVFIGQKSLRKGLQYLIDAFNKIKHPFKRLHIIGSDTIDKSFFDNKLKKENIIVYGHVPQIKLNSIINKCHVFVLPSIEEGLAIVTLQALSSGCPIIVSEHTGVSEIVRENNCGIVVPIRNSQSILQSLEEVIDDRKKLKSFSENAKKFALRNTWDTYVDKLDAIVNDKFKNNL